MRKIKLTEQEIMEQLNSQEVQGLDRVAIRRFKYECENCFKHYNYDYDANHCEGSHLRENCKHKNTILSFDRYNEEIEKHCEKCDECLGIWDIQNLKEDQKFLAEIVKIAKKFGVEFEKREL